jgi:hypothetical protein
MVAFAAVFGVATQAHAQAGEQNSPPPKTTDSTTPADDPAVHHRAEFSRDSAAHALVAPR